MNITLTRIDGGLQVNPAPPYITKYLKYTHRSFETVQYRRVNKYEERLLHQTDGKGGVYTLQGFFEIICQLIHKHYDTFTINDHRAQLPKIDWDRVKKIGPRDYQIEPVVQFLKRGTENSGIINATGGWGKTFAQAITYAAWHNLNTILAIPLKEVFTQTYKKFVTLFPEKHVGRVGDGHYDISENITITTFKSLPRCATEKCQLLLIDELQATTGDVIQGVLTTTTPMRTFGYTATDEGLFNNADKLITGLFGERLVHIPYKEAQAKNAVVPGLVYFIDTPDMVVSSTSIEGKIVQGIKKNKSRNQLIAKITTLIPNAWQALIFVDTIQDHLVELYKCMPCCCKYIHRESSKKKIGTYALSSKQQKEVIKEFIENKIQFLIATDAFRAGVDVPNCRVVIQASGGSSEIEVLQEAFRGSRTLPEELRNELGVDDKTHFVLIDFMDVHDEQLEKMSYRRMEYYQKQGWKIKRVKSPEQIDWFDYK